MKANLFIRFKGIDHDNDSAVDLAELGESLTGFDSVFKSFAEILGAMGLESPKHLKPWHLLRRVALDQVKDYSEIYPYLKDGDLFKEPLPPEFLRAYQTSSAETFDVASRV